MGVMGLWSTSTRQRTRIEDCRLLDWTLGTMTAGRVLFLNGGWVSNCLKWGYPKSPWVEEYVSILSDGLWWSNESNDLDDWGYPYFRKPHIHIRTCWKQLKNQGNETAEYGIKMIETTKHQQTLHFTSSSWLIHEGYQLHPTISYYILYIYYYLSQSASTPQVLISGVIAFLTGH